LLVSGANPYFAAAYRGIGPGYWTQKAIDPVVFVMPLKVFNGKRQAHRVVSNQ